VINHIVIDGGNQLSGSFAHARIGRAEQSSDLDDTVMHLTRADVRDRREAVVRIDDTL
jgi:hypothetical protein